MIIEIMTEQKEENVVGFMKTLCSQNRIQILNPDYVILKEAVKPGKSGVFFEAFLRADENLKRIVHYKQPKPIYDKLSDKIKQLVIQNQPIPLSEEHTFVMSKNPPIVGIIRAGENIVNLDIYNSNP